MRIRRAKPSDSAELARLHRATIRNVNSQDYSQKKIEVWSKRTCAERFRNSHNIAIRFVASEKKKIIGFCDISKENPEDLWGLYVHKDYLGKGIGKKLLQRIEEVAKKLGATKFKIISTTTAKKFYESQGFVTFKKRKHMLEYRGEKHEIDVYDMEKKF